MAPSPSSTNGVVLIAVNRSAFNDQLPTGKGTFMPTAT
jgi:hypothetical protein